MEKLSLPKRQKINPAGLPVSQPVLPKKTKWYQNEDFILGLGVGSLITILVLLAFLMLYGLAGVILSII